MTSATVGGIRIAYDDAGHGGALVLVHGHPFDRSMWRPQVDYFSRTGWRVIAPDLRGYGASTVVPGVTALEIFARDIHGLLDHLALDSVVLGGLSMGGQIAMEFARLFPERLRGLLLAATSAQAETEAGKQARNDAADRLLREGMGAYADEALPRMLAPATIAEQPSVAEHVLRMMRGASPEGAAAALRGRAERPDYIDLLASLSFPAAVVVGREDDFTPVPDAALMASHVADGSPHIIDGAAHLPNLEQPEAFNTLVEAFLAAVAPSARQSA